MNDILSADHQVSASDDAGTVNDVVCGMMVDPLKTAHHAEHAGQAYHFCSSGCRTKFIAHPAAFLGDRPRQELMATAGAIWTCPMHPQIRQIGPGACPICGMALEPEIITADEAPNAELIDMNRRFWVGLALAAPIVVA